MRRGVQLAIIIIATIVAFSNILGNEFVWDDPFYILEWDKVRSWQYLPDMLSGAVPPRYTGQYRPILGLAYLVGYQVFGENPWGWHAVTLLVHLAATVLVYFIAALLIARSAAGPAARHPHPMSSSAKADLRALDGGPPLASPAAPLTPRSLVPFVASLLFGLHPIHTEAITYIGSGLNHIGAVFFFASFWLYLLARGKKRSMWLYILSVVFSLFAFFTYEFTLTLPLLIVLYHVILSPAKRGEGSRRFFPASWRVRMTLPYAGAAFFYLFLRVFVVHIGGRGEYLLGSFPLTMLTMTKAFLRYLELLVLPINQTVFHTLPEGILTNVYIDLKQEAIARQTLFEPSVLLSVAILAILAILAIWSFRKHPLISFSLGWFFISLLPASNLIPVQELMAERYLYIPSFGFVLFLAYLIFNFQFSIFNQIQMFKNLDNENSMKIKNLALIIVMVIAITYGYLTFQRNTAWQSNLTLWLDTTKKSPTSEIAHYNLGNAYYRRAESDKAIEEYRKAIANKPNSMGSYINLGAIYLEQGKLDLSLSAYQKALAIDPRSATNHNNVGAVYAEKGDYQQALKHYLLALLIDPKFQKARDNIARLKLLDPSLSVDATLKKLQ